MASTTGASVEREFNQALENFKASAELSEEELQSFQFTKIEDVQASMMTLQRQQSKSKRLRYMRRLEPFFNTMVEYGKVIEVFVNTSEMLAFIWVASTFSEAFSSLLDAYKQIGDQMPLLSSYQSLFSDHPHMRSLLVMIFEDILAFHKEALRYFKKNLWKQLFQATWKGFVSKIENLRDNMRRHRQLIESRATLIQFEAVQTHRRLTEVKFQEMYEADLTRRRAAVLLWLSPANVEEIHERHTLARSGNPSAGQWLMSDNRFQKWFDPLYCSTPLLWLNGKPGAGKSVLASIIIDRARMLPDVSTAFFYCSEADPLRNNFISIARGLLSQLLVQDDSLLLLMDDKMSTKSGDPVLSSAVLAKELLEISLKSRKTYIILDGIDECSRDQRKEICIWFIKLVDSLPRTKMDEIRCLFISQDDGIARKDLSVLPSIKIATENTRDDIETFAVIRKDLIEERFGTFNKEELDIVRVVTARSQGMFIFARCVLEELLLQPSRHTLLVEWQANRFPEGLDELYQRILQRVIGTGPRTQHETTRRLLAWISGAKRPLKWYEIQGAISIDLDEQKINDENRRLASNAKDLCASLVEVHPSQTVELIHPTLKEYEIVKSIDIERELCALSVAYLCFPDISVKAQAEEVDISLLAGSYAFYDYAVACWVPHLLSWLPQAKPQDIHDLGEDLGTLLELHYSGAESSQPVSKSIQDKMKGLEILKDIHHSLVQSIIWTRKLRLANEEQSSHDLLDFREITTKIRSALEAMCKPNTSAETKAKLSKYYGTEMFKCPQVYCQHFYDGFQKVEDRDKHLQRHHRAYICTFEGCPTATFGCVSKADLDKHMLEYHGVCDGENEFPNVQKPHKQHKTLEKRTFPCTLCPKVFTRAYTLGNHLRSHTGERPFVCDVCGKAFARSNDKERHNIQVHAEMKRFKCSGELEDGTQWGCGKGFGRVESVRLHINSKAGRVCIKPLRDINPSRDEVSIIEQAVLEIVD
ncbi:hypothetical protein F5Y04DRAFT_273551 [Hypomontagnella monticulosa]|nr:hypothetical protein F5Y04DRAFT_273551 [Hypomontagnella monticulosa]